MFNFCVFLTIYARIIFEKSSQTRPLDFVVSIPCGRRCLNCIMNQVKCQRLFLFLLLLSAFQGWSKRRQLQAYDWKILHLKGDNHDFSVSNVQVPQLSLCVLNFHFSWKALNLLSRDFLVQFLSEIFIFPSTTTRGATRRKKQGK